MTQPIEPAALQNRINTLVQAGHDWMAPDLAATLAASPTSDQQMVQTANTYRTAMNSALIPVQAAFDDPVLAKPVTSALRVFSFIQQRFGQAPLLDSDLIHAQQQLQVNGYGKGLETTGVWTPDWQEAYSQYAQAYRDEQLHGKGQPLTVTAGKGIAGFFNSFLAHEALPAVWGALKAIPEGLRSLAGDVAGGTARAGEALLHPIQFIEGKDHVAANVSAQVQRALGADVTPRQLEQHRFDRAVNDFSTLASIVPLFKGGTAVARAYGDARSAGFLTDLGADAAKRGPGRIVTSLWRPSVAVQDGYNGLLATRLFANTPALKHLGPIVGKVFDEEGLYYRSRSFLATPYRLPLVQALGSAGQSVLLTGAAERGLAALTNQLSPSAALPTSVYEEAPLKGPFATALDLLSGGLHGPMGRPGIGVDPSATAGDLVSGAGKAYDAALGPISVADDFYRGTGIHVEDLAGEIGWEATQDLLNEKINQFAAYHAARAVTGGSYARRDEFRQVASNVLNDPGLLAAAREDLLAHHDELRFAFRRDANEITGDPTHQYRQGLASYAKARSYAQRLLANPEYRDLLPTPERIEAIKDAQTAGQIAGHPVAPERVDLRRGAVGLARKDPDGFQSAQEGQHTAAGLFARLRQAGYGDRVDQAIEQAGLDLPVTASREFNRGPVLPPERDVQAAQQVRKDAYNYLVKYAQVSPNDANRLDAVQMVARIGQEAKGWAQELHLPLDAPDGLKTLNQQIQDAGYRLVYGTDIGHGLEAPLIDPLVVQGHRAWLRDAASKMGLDNIPVSTEIAGRLQRVEWERLVQEQINTGALRVPPGYGKASRLINHVYSQVEEAQKLRAGQKIALALSKPAFRAMAEQAAGPGATPAQVEQAFRDIEARIATEISFRDLSLKEFVRAGMTPPPEIANLARDAELDSPILDEKGWRTVYALGLEAAARRPAWAMGLGKFEDVFRAGFGFAGKAVNIPVLNHAAMLPSTLLRLRDRYRFAYDPLFSLRRVAKTSLKMSVEGVPATIRPFEAMVKQGTLDDDLTLLNRLYPERAVEGEGFDVLDRYLNQQDIFGLFNPRHFMAYAAGWWKRAGLDDAAIRAKIDRTFTYGDRPAWERTIGTVFYPFSFDRTLYRNLGGYLLDHPGQRVQLTAALAAYNALSQHTDIGQWIDDHLPLLTEMKKLNAFEHGIGPGQLGGINAPYASVVWNLLGPQRIDKPSPSAFKTVQTLIPALRDLNSLLIGNDSTGTHGGTLLQQGETTWWSARNAASRVSDWVSGKKRSPLNPLPSNKDFYGQQDSAWQLRSALILQLAQVINYNDHHSQKIAFGNDPGIPDYLAGKTINRSTVNDIVHKYYPQWDSNRPASVAMAHRQQAQDYLQSLRSTDPQRFDAYTTFDKAAQKVVSYKRSHELDPGYWETLARLTAGFRQVAANLAEQDPSFAQFYRLYYQSSLGPLEAVVGL